MGEDQRRTSARLYILHPSRIPHPTIAYEKSQALDLRTISLKRVAAAASRLVNVLADCHGQITVSCRSHVEASSRSFKWVSIAYPGVVQFGVRGALRVEKTREAKASAYCGSKTREIQLSDAIASLEVLKGVHTGKETETSEFHRRM